MHRTNDRWCIWTSPGWLGRGIGLLRVGLKEVFDGAGDLPQGARNLEQVHLVVSLAHLVRQAARPSLDLIELVLILVVACLANVDSLVRREAPRAAFVVPGDEHDEAAVLYLVDTVVTVLARLDHLAVVEEFIIAVDGLFGAIVPARIYPLLPCAVLPRPEDLRYDRFLEIVGIANMNPVTCVCISNSHGAATLSMAVCSHSPTLQISPRCSM